MSERVAIYSRKSNEQHGSEETRSIAMPEGHARTCAAAQGWTVLGHPYLYEDDDISGKEFVRRPGLQRVMERHRQRAALAVRHPAYDGRVPART